jgi:hypothetical protein
MLSIHCEIGWIWIQTSAETEAREARRWSNQSSTLACNDEINVQVIFFCVINPFERGEREIEKKKIGDKQESLAITYVHTPTRAPCFWFFVFPPERVLSLSCTSTSIDFDATSSISSCRPPTSWFALGAPPLLAKSRAGLGWDARLPPAKLIKKQRPRVAEIHHHSSSTLEPSPL